MDRRRLARAFLETAAKQSRLIKISDGAPVESRALDPSSDYVRLSLLKHQAAMRRLLVFEQETALFAGFSLLESQPDGTNDFMRLIGPSKAFGSNGADRFSVGNEVLAGPIPFARGFKLTTGLIKTRNVKVLRETLSYLTELSANSAIPYLDAAKPFLEPVRRGVDLLFAEGASWDIRLDHTFRPEETGLYAVMAINNDKSTPALAYEPERKALVYSKSNRQVRKPYILVLVEGLGTRPDAHLIPSIKAAWDDLQTAVRDGSFNGAPAGAGLLKDLFARYGQTVALNRDLHFQDRERLLDVAKREFSLFQRAGDAFESAQDGNGSSSHHGLPSLKRMTAEAMTRRNVATEPASFESLFSKSDVPTANQQTLDQLIDKLIATVDHNGGAKLEIFIQDIRQVLGELDPKATGEPVRQVLLRACKALRTARRYEALTSLCNVAHDTGFRFAYVYKFLAQSRIEAGDGETARAFLEQAIQLAQRQRDSFEEADARSLRGRLEKDALLAELTLRRGDGRTRTQGKAARAFARAITDYQRAKTQNPDGEDLYQTVNLMALHALGARHRLPGSSSRKARALAREILYVVQSRSAVKITQYDYANAAEAALCLGQVDAAKNWINQYVTHENARNDNFGLNSTLTQLRGLWRETRGKDDPGVRELIVRLEEALLKAENGEVVMSANEMTALNEHLEQRTTAPPTAESTQGQETSWDGDEVQDIRYVQDLLQLSRFVAGVHFNRGRIGTGFVMRAEYLFDELPEGVAPREWLFVTNAHVVSDFSPKSIQDFHVEFTFFVGPTPEFENRITLLGDPLFTSQPSRHDCVVARLSDPLEWLGQANGPQASHHDLPPRRIKGPRVVVIGHRGGADIAYTLTRNELLDHNGPEPYQPISGEPVDLHYRAPTKPGNSGSPVFDARTLRVLGIHHYGSVAPFDDNPMPPRDYLANRGKWIRAIRTAMANVEERPRTLANTSPAQTPMAMAGLQSLNNPDERAPMEDGDFRDIEARQAMRELISQGGQEALPSVSSVSQTPIDDEAVDLIVRFEVSSQGYYSRVLRQPIWPGAMSGITIGIGYDLGYVSPDQFVDHWNEALPAATLQTLSTAVGLRASGRGEALIKSQQKMRQLVGEYQNVEVPWDAAYGVFKSKMLPLWTTLTERTFLNFAKLHPKSRGALVSLVFNRGSNVNGNNPRRVEMAEIADCMANEDFTPIPELIVAMKRIWEGKPVYGGLARRRDAEAQLFEEGLALSRVNTVPTILSPMTSSSVSVPTPGAHSGLADPLTGASSQRPEPGPPPPSQPIDQGTKPSAEETRLLDDYWHEENEDEGAVPEALGSSRGVVAAYSSWVNEGRPGIVAPVSDLTAVDYARLEPVATAERFHFTASGLRGLLENSAVSEEQLESDRVVFGLRGCMLRTDPVVHSESLHLAQVDYDHLSLKCVIGVWDRTTDQLSAFPGSTVPAMHYLRRRERSFQTGRVFKCNMLPTGVYRYHHGLHQAGRAGEQIGALRMAPGQYAVLRTTPQLPYGFSTASEWDLSMNNPHDNIHAALSTGTHFGSAGCQVVSGSIKNGWPTGLWAEFRKAVGLPDVTADLRAILVNSNPTPISYLLSTGREAAFAASGIRLSAPILRRGSQGPDVQRLQERLGNLSVDGDFGPATHKSLVEYQLRHTEDWADGMAGGAAGAANPFHSSSAQAGV